jgi:hypothetical protein
MNLDLLGGIELTASAAILSAILAAGLAETTRGRVAVVAGFSLWFALAIAVAASGTLHATDTAGTLGVGCFIALPLIVLAVAAGTSDGVRRALLRIPASSLVAANTVRILGISFVVLYSAGRLPAPFAPLAGWGDITVGLTAPVIAWLVATRGVEARAPLLAWNAIGFVDLIVAVSLGVASTPGPLHLIQTTPDATLMRTLPWFLIPGFLVPILLATHLVLFYRVRAAAGSSSRVHARPSPATP